MIINNTYGQLLSTTEDSTEFRAVSVSSDSGNSWNVILKGEFAHNFAFSNSDSIAYVAAENGVFKVFDVLNDSTEKLPSIFDAISQERVLTEDILSVGVLGDTLFLGSGDGLAFTSDDGISWRVRRGSVPAGSNGEPRTYAYPNPFSPFRHNRLGGDGNVRFQYNTTKATNVTIKVFDFAMELVAEVVTNKSQSGAGNFSEIWDGRNSRGDLVANGVYFYRVELDGDGVFWGKVIVLD